MSDFTFQMLLHSSYIDDENTIDKLHVEHLVDDTWQELDLNISSLGFDIFMYAILNCQHMYFRNNAAEYGLVLDSSEGLITVIADKHRSIETLNVEFKGKLKKGEATKEKVDSISARMALCPVSINLKDIANSHITASFESA
ncbi:MAG: hypothetical protein DRQ44_06495 [Gammaproteobacteria bacterium]|nr:MAG: hypothetical protein DRQ44_06495 [Gammaproteobacteria bacterium]